MLGGLWGHCFRKRWKVRSANTWLNRNDFNTQDSALLSFAINHFFRNKVYLLSHSMRRFFRKVHQILHVLPGSAHRACGGLWDGASFIKLRDRLRWGTGCGCHGSHHERRRCPDNNVMPAEIPASSWRKRGWSCCSLFSLFDVPSIRLRDLT